MDFNRDELARTTMQILESVISEDGSQGGITQALYVRLVKTSGYRVPHIQRKWLLIQPPTSQHII